MGKPGGRVFVAVDDGTVLGTAELHPNQPAAGSLGFQILATVPEAFEHPARGRVGLHVMHRPL